MKRYIKASEATPKFILMTVIDGDRGVDKFYSEAELVDHFRKDIKYLEPESCDYFDKDPSIFDINTVDDVITYIESGPYDTGWGYIPGCYWTLYDDTMAELAYGEM